MKLNKKKMAICLLAASTATVSFVSHASESFSTPSTGTAEFDVVAAPGTSDFNLLPAASLPAANVLQNDGVIVATATNNINGDAAQSGIRFSPEYAKQTVDPSNSVVVLHGDAGASDITLKIANATDTADWKQVNNDFYYVTQQKVSSQKLDVVLSGSQTIVPDTYHLSMDGVTYTP